MNDLGVAGELVAENYFRGRGYSLVKRNFRTKMGEIDLIMRKAGLFVFVEVKTRSSDCEWFALDSVGEGKRRKIRKVIQYFLVTAAEAAWVEEMRFDIVFITQERVANHIRGEFL